MRGEKKYCRIEKVCLCCNRLKVTEGIMLPHVLKYHEARSFCSKICAAKGSSGKRLKSISEDTKRKWKENMKRVRNQFLKKGEKLSDVAGLEKSIEIKRKIRAARAKQNFSLVSSHELRIKEVLTNMKIDYTHQFVYIKEDECLLAIPDFLVSGKLIIEVFGNYWHSLPNYVYNDKKKIKSYLLSDYKVLILWESFINSKTNLELENLINEVIRDEDDNFFSMGENVLLD